MTALLEVLVATAFSSLRLEFPPGSTWEVVFNMSSDACPDKGNPNATDDYSRDGTDSMPAAFYSPVTNLTYMWAAVSGGVRPNVAPGPRGLASVRHDCSRTLFNSSFLGDPASFANFQWLQAAHVFANGTGFALVHNEFHGWDVPNASSFCAYNKTVRPPRPHTLGGVCNMWSTGVARTRDGGETWQLVAPPPAHRVFSAPYRYERGDTVFGYGALSPALQGGDGAFYGLVHVVSKGAQPSANCAYRTPQPFDPASYRLWDGRGFNARSMDAYQPAAAALAAAAPAGVCTGVTNYSGAAGAPARDYSSHPSPRRLVGLGPSAPTYVLLGDHSAEAGVIQYRFSTEPDFARAVTRWASTPPLLLDLGLERYISAQGKVLYPTLLDERSPELGCNSFTHVGNDSAYVYVNVQRSLLRRRVLFRAAPAGPVPVPTPAPTPAPAPAGCSRFCVTGAGRPDANGAYELLAGRASDGRPMFQKDPDHQLYRFQGFWKIARYGAAGSQLFTQGEAHPNSTMPPPARWRSVSLWYAPAPAAVLCCSSAVSAGVSASAAGAAVEPAGKVLLAAAFPMRFCFFLIPLP
eukprot:g8027.t1